MSDLSKVQMMRAITAAGGEAGGLQAREFDGARIVIIELESVRLGKALPPFGFTLEEATKLRDWLTMAIARESKKGGL